MAIAILQFKLVTEAYQSLDECSRARLLRCRRVTAIITAGLSSHSGMRGKTSRMVTLKVELSKVRAAYREWKRTWDLKNLQKCITATAQRHAINKNEN
jgi:hypothetical protein